MYRPLSFLALQPFHRPLRHPSFAVRAGINLRSHPSQKSVWKLTVLKLSPSLAQEEGRDELNNEGRLSSSFRRDPEEFKLGLRVEEEDRGIGRLRSSFCKFKVEIRAGRWERKEARAGRRRSALTLPSARFSHFCWCNFIFLHSDHLSPKKPLSKTLVSLHFSDFSLYRTPFPCRPETPLS